MLVRRLLSSASAQPALRSLRGMVPRAAGLSSTSLKPNVSLLQRPSHSVATTAATAFKSAGAAGSSLHLNGARPSTAALLSTTSTIARSISSKASHEAAAAGSAATTVGGEHALDPTLSGIASRLQSMEQALTSSGSRSLVSVQSALDELRQVRIMLETHARVSAQDREGLKKVAGTTMTLNGLFLIYLFLSRQSSTAQKQSHICTWMMMLLTDLSGHMHGIPVVRMITLPKVAGAAGERRGGSADSSGIDVRVEPDKGFTDANTVPEPHLATSDKLQ